MGGELAGPGRGSRGGPHDVLPLRAGKLGARRSSQQTLRQTMVCISVAHLPLLCYRSKIPTRRQLTPALPQLHPTRTPPAPRPHPRGAGCGVRGAGCGQGLPAPCHVPVLRAHVVALAIELCGVVLLKKGVQQGLKGGLIRVVHHLGAGEEGAGEWSIVAPCSLSFLIVGTVGLEPSSLAHAFEKIKGNTGRWVLVCPRSSPDAQRGERRSGLKRAGLGEQLCTVGWVGGKWRRPCAGAGAIEILERLKTVSLTSTTSACPVSPLQTCAAQAGRQAQSGCSAALRCKCQHEG